MAFGHGDYEQSEKYCEQALELSQQVGDELRAALARVGLGLAAMGRPDHEAAASHLQEALRSFREADEDFLVAHVTNYLGMLALTRGEEGKATQTFEEGLAVARRIGDRASAYIALYNLAQIALSRGDHDQAAPLFKEGVTLSEQIGDRANVAYCLEGLAVVAGARGQAERCARLVGAAEGLHESVGVPVYVYYEPHRSLYERTMAAVRSRLGEEGFEEARAEGRAMGFEQAVVYALDKDEASPAASALEAGPAPPRGESPRGTSGQFLAEPLSERELEVLGLMASGMSNRDIARKLFVALSTVKTHTNNIYRKLGARSRTQAVAQARELKLL